MKTLIELLVTVIACGALFCACDDSPDDPLDADVEDSGVDSDTTDGDTTDAADADQHDADEAEPRYCDLANGDRNECDDCLPPDLDRATHRALATIFPNADQISAVGEGEEMYFVAELEAETLGYAFLADGRGYEIAPVSCITGVDAEGWSIRVEITAADPLEWLYQLDDDFYDQFRCLDTSELDALNHDWGPYDVDAVTGATITSYAVFESVWGALQQYEQVVD